MTHDHGNPSRAGARAGPAQMLNRRRFGLGMGGLAASGAVGGLAGIAGTAVGAHTGFVGPRPYRIGFIAPLTGPVAPEGIAMQRGFQLGLDRLNANGGIAGHRIEVVSQDSQGIPAVAGTVAKKFILEQKVDLILGTITGDEEDVVSALCAVAGVPALFPEHGFWHRYCDSTTVLMGENSFDLNAPLVPFVAEKFGKRFFLIGSDFSYPRANLAIAKRYMKKIGVAVLDEVYAPLGTPDWSSMIARIKSAAPDVIYAEIVGGDAIAFVKQAESLGLLPGAHVTGDLLQAEFYPAMGRAIDGQYACVRYTEDIRTSANKAFIAAYKKRHGPDPIPPVASTAYYCVDFIRAAVEKAGTYDRKAVFEAFRGLEVTTLLSDKPIGIDPVTMETRYPMYIVQIQHGGLHKIVKKVGIVESDLACS